MDLTNLDTLASKLDLKSILKDIDYRIAKNRDELEQAYSLVYKEYLKRNYTAENESKLRLSIHNTDPNTTTFISTAKDAVLATATIIPDSGLGLPMDKIYKKELDVLRKNNKKICEISMLASDTDLFKDGMSMMLNAKKMFFVFYLFKIILDYAKNNLKLDQICITINPKHKLTYDFLLFKDLGKIKTYQQANNAPAIAKYVDLNSIEDECIRTNRTGLYKMFFVKKTEPQKLLKKFKFSLDDLQYFFIKKTEILKTATPQELEYIKNCYPGYNFSEIII